MADESTSYFPSPLCSRPKSTGLSQLGRRRNTKRGKPSYEFGSRALPAPSEVWVPCSNKGMCANVFPTKRSHGRALSALFILLGSRSGQPRCSEAWWFGLGDGSCGLHYWRSPLKSQPCQDRPEPLIIRQLCPNLSELVAFWEKGLPGQHR